MKILIPRQDLFDAVAKVRTIVAPKSSLPILSHILMETGDSCIRLAATDLKVGIECEVDCTVYESGSLTVSCQRLASILAEMPNEDITLHLQDNNVIELKSGSIETHLFSLPPEEFPPIREFKGVGAITLRQDILQRMFARTSFAICTDQARHNLTGLLFELSGGKLTVVATDGRRMSLAVQDEDIPPETNVKVIIPSKTVHEFERLLSGEGDVIIHIEESQAGFTFDRVRIASALIEGNFPNYQMVVPQKHDKEVVVNTAKFTEAMRRAHAMTNEKFNSVRVAAGEGVMTLKVITPEVGEHTEDLVVEYAGEMVEIAFNPAFVLDILRHVTTEKVCLLLKDSVSPGVIKPYTEAPLDDYINVVMPIRI